MIDGKSARSLIIEGVVSGNQKGVIFRSWETEHKDWKSFLLGFFMCQCHLSINRFQENVNVIDGC